MRRPIIAGNWKLNKTPSAAVTLAGQLTQELGDVSQADIVIAPAFVALAPVALSLRDSRIELAAQNLFWEDSGAYTGEISAPMLADLGCRYAIIGHSERRQYFAETDQTVNRKLKAALAHQLEPIVCIGESLEEREAGQTIARIEHQLSGALRGLQTSDLSSLVLAYEPIWAIGTGRTATEEQAQEVHAFIRSYLARHYSPQLAQALRIQYGGSVKPDNAYGLLSQPDIDGALVGGASLEAASFVAIVKAGVRAKS